MRRRLWSLLLVAAAAQVGLGACAEGTPGPQGDGKVRVLLTDAPFPYDSVASVDLYIESIAASTSADTTSVGGQNWVTIAEPKRTFNLLDYQAGATALLGEADIPAGQYKAVRIVIDTDRSSVINKRGAPMAVNWFSSAGKATLHALVEGDIDGAAGGQIVIDIDVGRSFVCPGDFCGNTLNFIPWFRVVNTASTGSISGTVYQGGGIEGEAFASPIPNATITVFRAVGPQQSWYIVATGKTDAQGRYEVAFLRPGTYAVRADAPRESGFLPLQRDTVEVAAGEETEGINLYLMPGTTSSTFHLYGSSSRIAVGDTTTFSAWVGGPDSLTNPAITWESSAPAVARVATTGNSQHVLVIGEAVGEAMITARYQDQSASLPIEVTPPREVAEVAIDPPTQERFLGDTAAYFRAVARDADGAVIENRNFTFTSSDQSVARIRHTYRGFVNLELLKEGTVTITATTAGKSAEATLVVKPRP